MTQTEDTPKKYAAPAIDAMLDILEYLSAENRPCGVSEMSRELGVSTNLAFRIMKRLVERGYAECTVNSTYRLSTRFFSLGMKLYAQFELRRRARPYLEALSATVHTTCQLQVPEGREMLVMEVITPDAPFFLQVVPGARLNLHCNAFAKAVLAFMPEEKVAGLFSAEPVALTPHSITSMGAFLKELRQIRETGIAYDKEEYNLGIFCIGAPVFNIGGEAVAGLGLTGLSSLFPPERWEEAERQVLDCARQVSRAIGYEGKFFE